MISGRLDPDSGCQRVLVSVNASMRAGLGAAAQSSSGRSAPAERFAADYPYVTAGLVKHWCIRKWTVVVSAPGLG